MHHTGKKKKKEKRCPRGDSNTGPHYWESVLISTRRPSQSPRIICSKELYIPSLWWLTVFKNDFFPRFCVELNLLPIAARPKAHTHKRKIDTISGLVHAKPFEKFMNYWSRGYRLNRKIFSLLLNRLFIGRRKHQHNIVCHYLHCFKVRVANHLALRVRGAATWPLSPERRKMMWPPSRSFWL